MTDINFNIKVDPKTPQEITKAFASVPAALALTAHQSAFERRIARRFDARETDRIIAEIKVIGNFDAGQVGDINTAIRFSPFGGSSTATAQYIKDKVLEGMKLQSILDDVMGN